MFRTSAASVSMLILCSTSPVLAEKVDDSDLIEFSADTPAIAAEVNANFSAVQSAINGTDQQVQDLKDITNTRVRTFLPQGLTLTRQRMGDTSAGAVYDRHPNGLRWSATFVGGARIDMKAPGDYAGNGAELSIAFSTTTPDSGFASFFIRPESYNAGDSYPSPISITTDYVAVAGELVYVQTFDIPSGRLEGNWWHISIQRIGADSINNPETYDDDLVVHSVALEYETGVP